MVTDAGSWIEASIAQHSVGVGYYGLALRRRQSALRETAAAARQKISVRPLDVCDRVAVDPLETPV